MILVDIMGSFPLLRLRTALGVEEDMFVVTGMMR
jgi:hypothetical protein